MQCALNIYQMMVLSVLCLSFQWPTYTKRIVYIYHELLLILYTLLVGTDCCGTGHTRAKKQKSKTKRRTVSGGSSRPGRSSRQCYLERILSSATYTLTYTQGEKIRRLPKVIIFFFAICTLHLIS